MQEVLVNFGAEGQTLSKMGYAQLLLGVRPLLLTNLFYFP